MTKNTGTTTTDTPKTSPGTAATVAATPVATPAPVTAKTALEPMPPPPENGVFLAPDTATETTKLEVVKPKAPAAPKPSLGAQMQLVDPVELEAAVADRRAALYALVADPALPEPTRLALKALIDSAMEQKPGMEEMQTVWKLTRINIAQPTTRSEAKPDSARPGDMYTSGGQLLERPWAGIPLYFFEENVNFPEGGKNPICSAPDGKLGSPFGKCTECPHLPFGKQPGGFDAQKKTDCHSNIVAVMLAKDLSGLYIVQFGKTSRKTGSVMMQLAGQQTRVWKQSYVLNTEKKTNEVGLYFVYKVEPTGKDNAEDVCRVAEAFYGLYSAERKRMLADYYSRPARAAVAAAEAEGEFPTGAIEASLAGGDGEEPTDLNTPVKPAGATTTTARNASKPM